MAASEVEASTAAVSVAAVSTVEDSAAVVSTGEADLAATMADMVDSAVRLEGSVVAGTLAQLAASRVEGRGLATAWHPMPELLTANGVGSVASLMERDSELRMPDLSEDGTGDGADGVVVGATPDGGGAVGVSVLVGVGDGAGVPVGLGAGVPSGFGLRMGIALGDRGGLALPATFTPIRTELS